ncbi:DUF1009 domain-containing protein [Rhizobium leguminosarum bv. viciae]|jgi:DUF1009 family protein|nr:DUF1009 domain-containing protein [Rhizobium leguminosarum bv. viciae]
MSSLAVISGTGALSEQVRKVAEETSLLYTEYFIKPLLPNLEEPWRTLYKSKKLSAGILGLHPFKFSEIEEQLRKDKIQSIYFCGDFPKSQYFRVLMQQKIFGRLIRLGDKKFNQFFGATNNGFADPIRYYLALVNLLDSLGIKPMFARDLFPSFVTQEGDAARIHAPPAIVASLPNLLVTLGRHIDIISPQRVNLSQAAIVDSGVIVEVETTGTDQLIDSYGTKSLIKRRIPFLLKPPSVDFNPALDQPTIGPTTVAKCVRAKIAGIVVCAETTIVIDKRQTLQLLDQAEMFLYSIPFRQLAQVYRENFDHTWA